ncbi:MAG: lysophospholipid acyltransferase family protein [Pseudomonadota bacterium]
MQVLLAAFRSTLFALLLLILTPPYSAIALLTFPLPAMARYRVISFWSRIVVFLARVVCGIRYRVVGAEHIPRTPCIVLAKHQSAWETLAFQTIFPPQVWVLKRELLRIPFFGWGLAMMSPIAINRSAGREALRQLLEQGRDRLAQGFWVVIFPEGTRKAPGERGKYQIGGAWLAAHAGATVLPVAHNAGELWKRHAFIKYPGTITVSIGAPIDGAGMKAEEVNARAENWIEEEMRRITHSARNMRAA